jgi:hypothetical protein
MSSASARMRSYALLPVDTVRDTRAAMPAGRTRTEQRPARLRRLRGRKGQQHAAARAQRRPPQRRARSGEGRLVVKRQGKTAPAPRAYCDAR